LEVVVDNLDAAITLGPVQFNWKPETWPDFYFRIADEAPIDVVYLGETICSKRGIFFEPHYEAVAARLKAAGKIVVFSTLAEVMLKLDRQMVERVCALQDELVEVNDVSALTGLQGRPHHIGPFMNVYNEETVAFLARRGASNFCLPPEMPAVSVGALCDRISTLNVTVEVQVFGRISLALSARCYHARAHGRTRDSCQFVCENDPDGLELQTLDGESFLAINGMQTLSYEYLNLISSLDELQTMGVSRFRLSPHSCDMAEIASVFRSVLDYRISAAEGAARLDALNLPAPFANGFYFGKPGNKWIAPDQSPEKTQDA
jgi:O2-independent ubiquinone biosynthesis protein UbiV